MLDCCLHVVHNLRFEKGKAWYTNQFVPDNRYLVEEELGRSFFPTLGEYNGFPGLAKTLFNIDMVRERVSDLNTAVSHTHLTLPTIYSV
mgnify:CR=1 FL=1